MQETKYREGMPAIQRRALYIELIDRYDAAILDGMIHEWLSPETRNDVPVKYGNFVYRNGWIYFDNVQMELVDGALVEAELERRSQWGITRKHHRIRAFEVIVLQLEADVKEAKYVAALYDGTLAQHTPMYAIGDVFICGAMVALAEGLGAKHIEETKRRFGNSSLVKVPPTYDLRPQWNGEWFYFEFPDFESLNRFNTVRALLEDALKNEYRRGTDDGGNLLMALHKGTMTIENFNRSLEDRQRAQNMHRLA